MTKIRKYFQLLLLTFVFTCPQMAKGQDTLVFYGVISRKIILESIELYPDSTFKWTSEFDLSWDEFGSYRIENQKMELKYFLVSNLPKTMTLKDSIAEIGNPFKIEFYIFENEKLYRLDKFGKKQKRIKNTGIRTNWSWLYFNRHKFEFQKMKN